MSERNQESSFTAPVKSPGQSAITMRLTGAGAVEQSEQRTNTLRAAKKGASSTVIACTNWSKIYVCSRDLCLRRSYNYLWGTLEIFSGLRLVLGPPLGGFLYQSCGYEEPFISLGCIVLLMVPLNMRILPDHESDPGEHSFWKLITLPKVTLMAFAVSSVSSCFGFLDVTLSLFVLEKPALDIVSGISHK
ncbi:Mfs-Type Transporter Slc18B1 [Manis pentadactyla]|nr:Mfs-Type Transporter Slc18B1 [Manis pentadactyla]